MTPPTIRRRDYGRNHTYSVNGSKVPGATSILQAYPKPALVGWAAKAAADEVVNYWDDLAEMLPAERRERVRTAPNRDRDAAARRGTEVHRFVQQYLAGEEISPADELVGHVDAGIAFEQEWEVREVLVETTVANASLRYCGTLDLIADLADGRRWLLDLKTTRSGVFREVVLQLAAYRFAEWYLAGDDVKPMIPVDACGAVWLKADRTYDLIPVQADPQALAVFLHCKHVYDFAQAEDERLGAALTPPVETAA